jgi:hypothetical protein
MDRVASSSDQDFCGENDCSDGDLVITRHGRRVQSRDRQPVDLQVVETAEPCNPIPAWVVLD